MITSILENDAFNSITTGLVDASHQNQRIIPWSYYVLGGCTVVGVVIAVAGYVFAQMAVFSLAIAFSMVSGLGAYEIKSLSLTRKFEESVDQYKGLNEQLIGEIKQLKDEKNRWDDSNKELQQKIDSISEQNLKSEELIKKLQGSDLETQKQMNSVKEQGEAFKNLEEGLKIQVDTLFKEKEELLHLSTSQEQCVQLLKDQNHELEEDINKLKTTVAAFQDQLKKYADQNKDFKEAAENAKTTFSILTDNTRVMNQQNEALKDSITKMANENELLKKNQQKKEKISNELEETITALETKVVKKVDKMMKAKQNYEEKILELEKELNLLKIENESLKIQPLHHSETTLHLQPKTHSEHGK